MKGIHGPFLFFAMGPSFATMHVEDFYLESAIVLWSGSVKVVVTVPAREADKLEARLSMCWTKGTTLQSICPPRGRDCASLSAS
jgi:hypothetical protein